MEVMLKASIDTVPCAVGTLATPSNETSVNASDPAAMVDTTAETVSAGGLARRCRRRARGDDAVGLVVGPGDAVGVGVGVGVVVVVGGGVAVGVVTGVVGDGADWVRR